MLFEKVVIITGASKGIGAALAGSFRELGYGVVANARSMTRTEAAGDPGIVMIDGDVAAAATAERIVAGAMERFGRIDTLINNAGIFIPKAFTDYSEADFAATTGTNLAGFFHVTQRVASVMLSSGQGHIVNITATIAEQPMSVLPAALATLTKGGLNAVTRSLAIEYASRGIRVNAVSPGAVKTPMHPPEAHQFLAGLQPMGRMVEIQDVLDAVLYLEKAANVTGEILHVDGGWSAGR
jgi:NAD(P)-dependent dehydrogenase (short-subunit alcohol dehydrogenase family)